MTTKVDREIKLDPQQQKLRDLKIAYKNCFGTREGKKVLQDLLQFCHMMVPSYKGDLDDTVFNEGMRNVALYILKNIQTDLDGLTRHFEEIEKEKDYEYFE